MADDILGEIRASKKKFYVYILRKPDGTPFYVGMGKGERVLRHERLARGKSKGYRLSVIRKIWRAGGDVRKEIESWHDTAESALNREAVLTLETCESLLKKHRLTSPDARSSLPHWREFENRIRLLTNDKGECDANDAC